MRAIAVTNQKGGVGKTTVTLNLATGLCEAGRPTLVVDLDPQGYATYGAGESDRYEAEGPNLATALLEGEPESLGELAVRVNDGFDLVPSHLDMLVAEPRMYAMRGRERRLAQVLATAGERWDYCLIDCPASLGVLTDNAIVAAGEVLVPFKPDGLSLRALELLLDQIASIRQGLGVDPQPLGLVANMVDDTAIAKRALADLAAAVPIPILGTIRRRSALSSAWEKGRSIISTEPISHGAIAYRELARAVIATEAGERP